MADVEKFVQLVESYPCLYKNSLGDYSKKDVTERAWASISAQMKWSVTDCKDKWKNLRNGFVRSLKPPASGSSAKAKKPYYLYDAMQFVLPYVRAVQHMENTSNISMSEMEEEFLIEGNSNSYLDDDSWEVTPTPSGSNHDNNPESHPANESNGRSLCTTSSAKKRKSTQQKDEVDIAILDYVKKKESKPEDSQQMFLMSLLPDVRSLSDANFRSFKIRVMMLLEELLNEHRQPSARRELYNEAPLSYQNVQLCTPAPTPNDAPNYATVVYETFGEN